MKFSSVLALGAALVMVEATNEITVYADPDYKGAWVKAWNTGDYDYNVCLPFNGDSYKYSGSIGDGCCVRFCNNGKDVGYRCSSHSTKQSSSKIDQVVLGCGSAPLDCLTASWCRERVAVDFADDEFNPANATTGMEAFN